jgi:hypothetical protein
VVYNERYQVAVQLRVLRAEGTESQSVVLVPIQSGNCEWGRGGDILGTVLLLHNDSRGIAEGGIGYLHRCSCSGDTGGIDNARSEIHIVDIVVI